MRTLRISHRTRYSYDRCVSFGLHRLMIRPRDAHDMRILDSSLTITPSADVRWAFDTFGNSVALLSFHEAADELVIASELVLRRYGFDEPMTRIERHAGAYPFQYEAEDSIDLAPLLPLQCPQDRATVEQWVSQALPDLPDGSLRLLDMLSSVIHRSFVYRRREEIGVQSPAQTILTASGTCRDFALLFMEAARVLGFAARFVTGYLYDPLHDLKDDGTPDPSAQEHLSGTGATHAWADIFLPGLGWIEFDPTNRIVAGRNLVRVAATRTPAQALPVSGSYSHDGAQCLGMDVQVSVTRSTYHQD
ncbi:transglutaminase family protein [Oceanibaculum pacificum]|uniref:Transglutaminase n=1 Tax=Oceanibaculum pacificum TaxID=580166 RepID=A0A154W7A2_9PROT|nr:transglutaminase family protein [Oceanibaculum pacificum]KZD09414.1 transglutaminase [Oceanibaculum pacificum]